MGLRIFPRLLIAAATLGAAVSCAGNRDAVVAAIEERLAAADLKSALGARLCGPPAAARCAGRAEEVWKDVRAFYEKRAGEPIWVTAKAPSRAAKDAIAALQAAADHGLEPERYGTASLASTSDRLKEAESASNTDLAAFEIEVTAGLLALGRDVAIGRPGTPPQGVATSRKRTPPDFVARFTSVVDEGDLDAWPGDVQPVRHEYGALRKALADLRSSANTPESHSEAVRQARILALNMERWRWMPDDLGDRHIVVNVPAFHLFVRERDNTMLDSKVVVGKRGDETPLFSSNMTQVVFSPYWNIPESIAAGETVPAIIRNPSYLARNRIDVLRRVDGKVERVDPGSVNWNDPAETQDISLRQRPGAGNALGHVKFLFPNRYSVYLHDTPADELFARAGRAFSHGCVRVERPVDLAKYVLGDQPEWTNEKIQAAMHSGDEKTVKLKKPIPVHIVYFTAWPDSSGGVTYYDDVYGKDR